MKIATVFSGIGAIEHALQRLNVEHEIVLACDQDKFCKQTYFANYDITEEKWYSDIKSIDGNKYKHQIDLFVGGSPCQSFSVAGQRLGFNDSRGNLFFEFARLINEIKPKVFIFENVKGLLFNDNGKTWVTVENTFKELGYKYYKQILNAKDYGIPQNRNRLFVIGFLQERDFEFPKPIPLNITMQDLLIDNPDEKYFLSERGKQNALTPRKGDSHKKIVTDLKIAKTLMTKNRRASDSNYITNGDKIRPLTPRESHRLMGFSDDFRIVVSDTQAYKQAGNSIVVDVLMNILKSIYQL